MQHLAEKTKWVGARRAVGVRCGRRSEVEKGVDCGRRSVVQGQDIENI
jgi:hypothetical protein